MSNTPNNDNNNKKRDDNDLINDFNSQQNMASSMPNLISHQMNNTLNNDNNNKKLHIWVRKGWKHGSKVNVYSHTATQWATGTVERQFQDDEGEWLEIKYSINNKVRFKQIQRYNNHIRPWQPIMPICIYIYDAITVPTINTSQLQLLDAYSNTSNGSRKSRKYESRRPSHAIPNEIHSPTTHENINYCDEDEIVTVYNENNNINIIFHPEKRDDLCAQQDINKCLSAQRLKYILDTNNNYSDKIDIMMKTLDNIFKQYDYTNTSLLDDFNHVKYYNHNNKEEEIDDFEFNKIFTYFTNNITMCEIDKCKHIQNHYRDRTTMKNEYSYNGNDDNKYMIELISRVHVYFIHSYQINRLTLEELENINKQIQKLESQDAKEIDHDLLEDTKNQIIANIMSKKRRDHKKIPRYREDIVIEKKNNNDNSILDYNEIYNILQENKIKIEISQLKSALGEYKDKNKFINNIIEVYYQNDQHTPLDNHISTEYLPSNRQKRKEIYELILYKYIKLTELNGINLMKIMEKIIDGMSGRNIDINDFKNIAKTLNLSGNIFIKSSEEFQNSIKFAKCFSSIPGYKKKIFVKIYNTVKKWSPQKQGKNTKKSENINTVISPISFKSPIPITPISDMENETNEMDEIKETCLDFQRMYNILQTDIIIDINELKVIFHKHNDLDKFISDIIDAYYINNDEYLIENFINIQYLNTIINDMKTRNELYTQILFKYIKITELNHTNFAKMGKKIILDTHTSDSNIMDLDKFTEITVTNKINGNIFIVKIDGKKNPQFKNMSKFAILFENINGYKKTIFINLYKTMKKWKPTRNENSLKQIGKSTELQPELRLQKSADSISSMIGYGKEDSLESNQSISSSGSSDKNTDKTTYKIGTRYFYWESHKTHKHYIQPKWDNLKNELLNLNHDRIEFNIKRWESLVHECNKDIKTYAVKELKSNGIDYFTYKIEKDKPFTFEHLCALKLYTDYTSEVSFWCSILRNENVEKIAQIAIRTRLLAECVQCYGSKLDRYKYYRGVKNVFEFKQFATRFNLPTSTTRDFTEATKFSMDGTGLVIELSRYKSRYDVFSFDCFKISKFPEEKETLFFAGNTVLRISSIFQTFNNEWQNYKKYMEPLNIILRMIHGLSVKEEKRMLGNKKYKKTMTDLLYYVFNKFNMKKTMLQLPNYIDQVLKHHMHNSEIKLNFMELRKYYPWMDSLFIKYNKYSDKKLLNVSNICKLFSNSNKITFIMPANYIFSYIECISFIQQDLLEIAVNDISVSITFKWPIEMPFKNRDRIRVYHNELKRLRFVPTFRPHSVRFEFDADETASTPALGLFAQIQIYSRSISDQTQTPNTPETDTDPYGKVFELINEVSFNCKLTVKRYIERCQIQFILTREIPQTAENIIVMYYAKPSWMNIRYGHEPDRILYCPINDTWQSITDKIMVTFKINKSEKIISSLCYRIYGGVGIGKYIDEWTWKDVRWKEKDEFEIQIDKNLVFADSWTPQSSYRNSNNSIKFNNMIGSADTQASTSAAADFPTTNMTSRWSSDSYLNIPSRISGLSPPIKFIEQPMISWETTGNISSNPLQSQYQITRLSSHLSSNTIKTKKVRFSNTVHSYDIDEKSEHTPSMNHDIDETFFLNYDDMDEDDIPEEKQMPYEYCASMSTGIYGSNIYYNHNRQKWLNKNKKKRDTFSKLNIVNQLRYSIPDKISIDHVAHKLFIDEIQKFNRDEYLDDIVVTNDKNEHYVPDLDSAITHIQMQNNDWTSVLYDVCLYHYTDCRLMNDNTFNIANIKFNDDKRTHEWIDYLYYRAKSRMTDENQNRPRNENDARSRRIFGETALRKDLVDVPTQHKIADSILGYHHYTLAVSHILKVCDINKLIPNHSSSIIKVSVVFIIKKRYAMYQHGFTRDIGVMLREADMAYSWTKLNGFVLNETIKVIFRTLGEYKQNATSSQIVLLFKFDNDKTKTHQSNACTMYIYSQFTDPQSTILPYTYDNHWSLFILEFKYFSKQKVKCYWKIDGKTLRFFPEHMENVWPTYFLMKSEDMKALKFDHKYRHQFGIGLYDKSFCKLYYALTQKRFLSTHYYRQYHCKPKLSLKTLKLPINNHGLISEYETFKQMLNNECKINDKLNQHECSRINRLVFMLKKHGNNQLEELCLILQKCHIYDLKDIQEDVDHLMKIHHTKFDKIFNHIFDHMIKHENVNECKVKLACWALRRRTRSIYRIETIHNENDNKEDDDPLEIKTLRRILDHLHCDVFHRFPTKGFRQMFVNRAKTGFLHTATLADFEKILLSNVPKWENVYEELRVEKLSEPNINRFNGDMIDKGYLMDKIRVIEDLQQINNKHNIYEYIRKLPNSQIYEKIITNFVNNNYLRIAAVFRKYKIREEIFVNADKKDIKDLIKLENMELESKQFDDMYDRIRFHGQHDKKEDDNKDEKQHDEFMTYAADNSDKWLSQIHKPKFKSMEIEFLQNSFSPISRSEYIDTDLECQSLHEKSNNKDIMSLEELIALKIFTDYSNLQTEFSKSYYSDNTKEKKRKREFYHWNLILKQAMHYAAGPSGIDEKLYRGLKGLFHFKSLTAIAEQPTSFSLKKHKAERFCDDNGILLESKDAIGIPLKWLSNFQHEDEWWCFNTTFKLERIHIKTQNICERCDYLRYSLINMSYSIPKGDINFFAFDINDDEEIETDMKDNDDEISNDNNHNINDKYIQQYVIDLLDFDETNSQILTMTKCNGLTLLQRLFFELKQYYMLEYIWNFDTDDIEISNVLQRVYLLEMHIFNNIDTNSKIHKYKNDIMNFMINSISISIDSALCPSIAGYIQFISMVKQSIDEYNKQKKNRIKISEIQMKRIINYFKKNNWNSEIFKNTDDKTIKLQIFLKELGIQRTPSAKLYKIIYNKISMESSLKTDDFEEFLAEIIKYKQINDCDTQQLKYILHRHILPQMDSNSATLKHEEYIFDYIEDKQLDGNNILNNNVEIFSENIANYIKEHESNTDTTNIGEPINETERFIQILDAAIDVHESTYGNTKKKLSAPKEKIMNYFESNPIDCYTFKNMAKTKFSKQILFKKLKIKMMSGNKLHEIINKMIQKGIPINATKDSQSKPQLIPLIFTDLYNEINQWKNTKHGESHTIIEYKLQKSKFDAFDVLIGNFDLEFNDEDAEFQLIFDQRQQELIAQYPPKLKLSFKRENKNEWKGSAESTTTSFRFNISDIINEPSILYYQISLTYGKEKESKQYELISKIKPIDINKQVIETCQKLSNILPN